VENRHGIAKLLHISSSVGRKRLLLEISSIPELENNLLWQLCKLKSIYLCCVLKVQQQEFTMKIKISSVF
jgi:hypothetical protein